MHDARLRQDIRIAGRLYVAYFVIALAGGLLQSLALSLVGTAAYFVLAVQLYRVVAPVDRRVSFVLLPLAALGCVTQGAAMVGTDRPLQLLALVFFGLFLVVLGYLAARSGFMPRAIGVYLSLAGIAWCAVVLPGAPLPVAMGVVVFGGLAELVLAVWLLFGAPREALH
jgi:Domain of unknown function (DUF4386)